MVTKSGFTKMNTSEFKDWIGKVKISRPIKAIQQHHTWIPNFGHFRGSNHFEMQNGMKSSHLSRGFNDIGQHFSIFPDGTIVTGRDVNSTPAGIKGFNTGCICLEHIGSFDNGMDNMTRAQKDAIILVNAELCKKLRLQLSPNNIVYHHWFNLETGVRNNGTGNNKTCPGTNFFGGNTIQACEQNFLPLIEEQGVPRSKDVEVLENEAPTFENEEDYQDIDEETIEPFVKGL